MATLDLAPIKFSEPVITTINSLLPRLPTVIFDLLVGILIVRILSRLLRFTLTLTTLQLGLRDVIASTIEILLWLFLTITILQALGFNNVVVFFSGSVAAIGLAMAAGGSTLISDIVAGIFLARDTDFNVGDEVIAGETPTRGIIESMDARRTRLRDRDGVLHIIPNSIVERKEWVLISKSEEVSVIVKAAKAARRLRTAALGTRAAVAGKTAASRQRKPAPNEKVTVIQNNAQ